MNETQYPLSNLLPIGTRIKVTYVSNYENNQDRKLGQVVSIIEHDEYDDRRPYQVSLDGEVFWCNGVEADAPVTTIGSKDLSDLLVRNGASAQLAVELVGFLRDHGVEVKFSN